MGAGRSYSANSVRCRYGSSTASVIASICVSRPPTSAYVMSGTSSRTSSSVSGFGSFSMSSCVRTSISSESPARSRTSKRSSLSSATRSSSARAKTMHRRRSSRPLLERDDLARQLAVADEDDVERLVQDDLVALADHARVDVRVQGDPHLAAAGEDVDRPVLVDPEERPVRGRRLGELLDLLAESGELLLGLLQRERQLLVLGDRVGELALGLEQPLLQCLDAARALLEATTEGVDLVLGLEESTAKDFELVLASFVLSSIRRRTHLPHPDLCSPYRYGRGRWGTLTYARRPACPY